MDTFNMDTLLLDLPVAPFDVITRILESMSLSDRFTCALVCQSWAKAATAATRSIIIRHRLQDLSSLQCWLKEHGSHLEVLQLHDCDGATLTALPCPQLRDLLLHGPYEKYGHLTMDSEVWCGIAAAEKLTSVSLSHVSSTGAKPADVVSALTALSDLQQLTWKVIGINGVEDPLASSLLQQMTQLTYLDLHGTSSDGLQFRIQPLSSLTKLQYLCISGDHDWFDDDCPGLQELKALTGLHLSKLPATIVQLTALQQLEVESASLLAINGLQVLPALTNFATWHLRREWENWEEGQSLQL